MRQEIVTQVKKTDSEVANKLGISRQSWQLYRTHPERFPEYRFLSALLDTPIWEDVIGYLRGRVSKEELVFKICDLQDGNNNG